MWRKLLKKLTNSFLRTPEVARSIPPRPPRTCTKCPRRCLRDGWVGSCRRDVSVTCPVTPVFCQLLSFCVHRPTPDVAVGDLNRNLLAFSVTVRSGALTLRLACKAQATRLFSCLLMNEALFHPLPPAFRRFHMLTSLSPLSLSSVCVSCGACLAACTHRYM